MRKTRKPRLKPRSKKLLVLARGRCWQCKGKRKKPQGRRRKKRRVEPKRNERVRRKSGDARQQKRKNAVRLSWQECRRSVIERRKNDRQRGLPLQVRTLILPAVHVANTCLHLCATVVPRADSMIAEEDDLLMEIAVAATVVAVVMGVEDMKVASKASVEIVAAEIKEEIAGVVTGAVGIVIAGTTGIVPRRSQERLAGVRHATRPVNLAKSFPPDKLCLMSALIDYLCN